MRKIYDLFYIFLLKLFKRESSDNDESFLIELNEKDHRETQKILNSKIYYDKLQYYVTWLDYFSTNDLWLSPHVPAFGRYYNDIWYK